ncbi:hypothetical protein Glove_426g27 [Diversispora epigaea]|uniref:NrS-1 polymerase-like helicase domain-containing protein n=1 Tax=Diversispora epigaea TaxID=1348612 RepID=A0A397GU52_9GLOM|nr:hypothetical protein Glove_426g27 [Diversispora epigaea]
MSTQSEHNTPMTRRVALKELVPASSEESEIQCSVSSDTPTEIFIPENQEQSKDRGRREWGVLLPGFKAESVTEYMYKIRDDSVRPRQFLGTDSEDGIEAIFTERQGHSLHEFIDGDNPLCPFIDFDLSQEKLNSIVPKLTRKETYYVLIGAFREVCIEIYPDWDIKTLTVANSSDQKKMSYHISTFGMRLTNITACALFTELVRKKLPVGLQAEKIVNNIANSSSFSLQMLGTPKIIKETNEHVRPKRAVIPENGTIFDFMLRPPNDEVPVIDSPFLEIPEEIVKNSKADNGTIGAEVDYVEKLLKVMNIEGFDVLYPTPVSLDIFTLRRITGSHCPLCNREHSSDNAYVVRNRKTYRYYCYRANQDTPRGTKKPSLKLIINETVENQEKTLPPPQKIERPRISDPNDHFVWGDLIDMCTSGEIYTRNQVYEAIQATIAYIQTTSRLWILKMEDSDNGFYYDMASKLDFAKYEIKMIEYGGETVKLKTLIDRSVIKGLILYRNIDFLSYPPNTSPINAKFFNLFLGFKAQPVIEINPTIMNPILWHAKNIISDGNEELSNYFWHWCAYLVQQPSKKPGTIQVLRSLPECGKNILIDFIGKKVLGSELFYATSDLGKILGRFNSCIQARKLIVMNETGMSSGDWNKYNDHLKSLITEDYLTVERKGIEPKVIKDYTGFMVLSNHDAPLRIEMAKVLEHSDAPNIVMTYLLSLDISDWNPQDIPATKMKTDIMLEHLPNPKRFIIDHISSWPENRTENSICSNLYQEYRIWCERNGENPFTNKKFGKTPPTIGIERKQVRINGKREWVYILDHSKIVAKLRESGIDIEEFSDVPQAETSSNAFTEISVFDIPEIIARGPVTPPESEKKITETSSTDRIEKGKDSSPAPSITNMTHINQPESSTNISMTSETIHVKAVDDKPKPPEIIESVGKSDLPVNDELELGTVSQ